MPTFPDLSDLQFSEPITNPDGTASDYFLRYLRDRGGFFSEAEQAIADILARQIIAGAGLTDGGDLSADVTLNVGAGTGITVNADDVAIDTTTEAERIRDVMGAALVAGSNVTITVDDGADTITIAASGGGGGGGEGVTFPGSPSDGQRFYRTDRKIEYYWDAAESLWLSTQEYQLQFQIDNFTAADLTTYAAVPYIDQYGLFMTRFEGVYFRTATANWNINLGGRTETNTVSTLATYNGGLGTNANWLTFSVSIDAELSSTVRTLNTFWDELSGSAAFYGGTVLYYRLIG